MKPKIQFIWACWYSRYCWYLFLFKLVYLAKKIFRFIWIKWITVIDFIKLGCFVIIFRKFNITCCLTNWWVQFRFSLTSSVCRYVQSILFLRSTKESCIIYLTLVMLRYEFLQRWKEISSTWSLRIWWKKGLWFNFIWMNSIFKFPVS